MRNPFPKIRIVRHQRRARVAARFGASLPDSLGDGFQLIAVEDVAPDLEMVADPDRIGFSILLYERRGRRRDRVSVTRGLTSPARVAGAPNGSFGEVDVDGRTVTWISGAWEVDEPSDIPPSQNPAARWSPRPVRLTWVGDDKVSTTIESYTLTLQQLVRIAENVSDDDTLDEAPSPE